MAYFLPPQFDPMKGTERGKVTSDTERMRIQKQINSCSSRAQLTVGSLQLERAAGHVLYSLFCSFSEEASIPPWQKHCMCNDRCAVIALSHVWFGEEVV